MADVYDIRNIDFEFDFTGTPLGVGSVVRSGGAGSLTDPYMLDSDSILEVCGVQLIGPVTLGGVRQKLEHVKLVIAGDSYPHVVFNELMAPPINEFSPNIGPFFENGSKLCFNIGKPILAGGSPADATPKVGPRKTLGVEVKVPAVGDAGVQVNQDLTVRVTVAEVKGEETAKRILRHYEAIVAGDAVRQSFELIDLERDLSATYDKDVEFSVKNWTKLHGGMDANKPRIWPYVSYAQNAANTTVNAEYGMYDIGNRVNQDFMDMYWNFDETEAMMLTHMGVLPQANLEGMRVYKYGRSTNPWFDVSVQENELPMGLDPNSFVQVFQGPKRLMRPRLIWDEKAQVEIIDDGTFVPAWAVGTPGAMVAAWGKYYEL